ncbi:MAG: hypothetical protein KDA93_12025 [Planctomycetaceae bacterium]|nr:hypothetical protein [Planctomycetaceae bacterium]
MGTNQSQADGSAVERKLEDRRYLHALQRFGTDRHPHDGGAVGLGDEVSLII